MSHEPIYPHHGTPYLQAMVAAQEEYSQWEQSRAEIGRGIRVYARVEFPEDADDAE